MNNFSDIVLFYVVTFAYIDKREFSHVSFIVQRTKGHRVELQPTIIYTNELN